MVIYNEERERQINEIKSKEGLLKYIKDYHKQLNEFEWFLITKSQYFTFDIAEKYSEYVDWEWICSTISLSEKIIKSNMGYVNWYAISAFQDLSWKFINDFKDKLSINNLINNEILRGKPYYSKIVKLYEKTKDDPEYQNIWKINLNNSMFKSSKKTILGKNDSLTIFYPVDNLEKMNKKDMKILLEKRGVRTYYHDTLEILKEKIRSSDRV